MSYDLEARSDEAYTQLLPRKQIHDIIGGLPNIFPNGPGGFILQRDDSLYMEIDVDRADENGDTIEDDMLYDDVNRVCFQVPAGYFMAINEAIPVAIQIGELIGWPVNDMQTNSLACLIHVARENSWDKYYQNANYATQYEDVEEGIPEKKPWWKFW